MFTQEQYQPTISDIENAGTYLAHGFVVIGKGNDGKHRLFKKLVCGHEQIAKVTNIINGHFRCKSCILEKIQANAKKEGVTFNGFFKKDDIKYCEYTLGCGHIKNIPYKNIRHKKKFCNVCNNEKWQKEAQDVGLLLNRSFTKKRQTYGDYTFLKCGHTQTIDIGSVRKKYVSCQTCNDSWVNKQSNLYLHRIDYDSTAFLKFGRAMNVEQRINQYGLAFGAKVQTIKIWDVATGGQGDQIEKLVAKHFKKYSKLKAKNVLMEQGHTECFHLDDMFRIIDFVQKTKSNIEACSVDSNKN
jgi:hypothetical protein